METNTNPAPATTLTVGAIVDFVSGGYKGCRGRVTRILDAEVFGFLFLDGMGEGDEEFGFINQVEVASAVMPQENLTGLEMELANVRFANEKGDKELMLNSLDLLIKRAEAMKVQVAW